MAVVCGEKNSFSISSGDNAIWLSLKARFFLIAPRYQQCPKHSPAEYSGVCDIECVESRVAHAYVNEIHDAAR
jgi:hypothetical protein